MHVFDIKLFEYNRDTYKYEFVLFQYISLDNKESKQRIILLLCLLFVLVFVASLLLVRLDRGGDGGGRIMTMALGCIGEPRGRW